MHLVQCEAGNYLIDPTFVLPDCGAVLWEDGECRAVIRAGKVSRVSEAEKRIRGMVKHLGLVGKVGEAREENTTVPGVGFCRAWVAPFEATKPPVKNGFLECRGDCPSPTLDHPFTAWWMEFDIGMIMDVFRGRHMNGLMIRFLTPFSPWLVDRPETRTYLANRLATMIPGFTRFKDPEAWFRKQGPERIKLCRK
jgi:hypothetical protein